MLEKMIATARGCNGGRLHGCARQAANYVLAQNVRQIYPGAVVVLEVRPDGIGLGREV